MGNEDPTKNLLVLYEILAPGSNVLKAQQLQL